MRVQLELDERAVNFLDTIGEKAGIKARTETLRHAVALLHWAIDKTEQGYTIVAVKEGSDVAKELSMPVLDEIGRRTHGVPVVSV